MSRSERDLSWLTIHVSVCHGVWFWNENYDAGHITCSSGSQILQPCFTDQNVDVSKAFCGVLPWNNHTGQKDKSKAKPLSIFLLFQKHHIFSPIITSRIKRGKLYENLGPISQHILQLKAQTTQFCTNYNNKNSCIWRESKNFIQSYQRRKYYLITVGYSSAV